MHILLIFFCCILSIVSFNNLILLADYSCYSIFFLFLLNLSLSLASLNLSSVMLSKLLLIFVWFHFSAFSYTNILFVEEIGWSASMKITFSWNFFGKLLNFIFIMNNDCFSMFLFLGRNKFFMVTSFDRFFNIISEGFIWFF